MQLILGLLLISWGVEKTWREVKTKPTNKKKKKKPFIMLSPKQLLCKQAGLIVGKSVISLVDLSTTCPLC